MATNTTPPPENTASDNLNEGDVSLLDLLTQKLSSYRKNGDREQNRASFSACSRAHLPLKLRSYGPENCSY